MKSTLALLLGCFLGSSVIASAQQAPPPLQYAELNRCPLDSGAAIENCRLGYRTLGTLDAARDNAILFPMWLTGRSGEAGALVGPGPGHLLDTNRHFVILVDPFGNGVSSSPSNSKAQPGILFPTFTIRDIVRAEERLVRDTLHLTHLRAVVGQSMGGMQAFEWAVDAPAAMDRVVSIVGTPQLSSADLFLWSAEKQALQSDPGYAGGRYVRNPPLPLVAYIHQMNLSTPEYRVDHTTREQVPQFLKQTVEQMQAGTDANDYLRQLEAMLSHDIAHGGSMYAAVHLITAKLLVIAAQQDHMVNPAPALAVARLAGAQTLVLTSDCGHMAPGCEMDKVLPVVGTFLSSK